MPRSKPAPKSGKPAAPTPARRQRVHRIVSDFHRQYLTRAEAAAYLGCSRKHLISLIRNRLVAEFDFGPQMKRYRREDLDAYAEARRRPAKAAA